MQMKMTLKTLIATIGLLLLSLHGVQAVSGAQLSIQGNDVHLGWASQPGQTFIIGYRPTLDPSTPWTVLETAYAASTNTTTTYVHAGVVVYPSAQDSGGGGDGFSASESKETKSWSEMTEEERVARREELNKQAQADIEYLMTLLKEAIAKAEADRERWEKEGFPSRDATADGGDPQPDGPDPNPPGSMGFYYVMETGEEPDLGPLTDGLVLSGQYDFQFTPDPNYMNILGPLLFCNDYVTADGLVTTEPEPGHLQLNWNSTFIQYDGGFFAPFGPQPDGPEPEITLEEKKALHAAFGEGTDMNVGRLSKPNQAKIDQLPEHVLDYAQHTASKQLQKDFQWIQEANMGVRQPPPGISMEQWMKIRMNSVHTQFTRMQSVNSSLFRRFGRAINRVLPFIGGIIILANADSIAADFLSAMQDYAHDILNGDDETGSAAILAGHCNDLAPGSGNIVLNYLLR